jgi:hypothetical protein
MKKIIAGSVFLIIMLFIIPGCYNDNEYDLYPFSAACDSSNVTYTQTIAPMMGSYCNSCHSASLASGNVVTDNITGLSIVAKNGKLWGGVNAEAGFIPMPYQGSKLSSCDLGKIKKWINGGALNN